MPLSPGGEIGDADGRGVALLQDKIIPPYQTCEQSCYETNLFYFTKPAIKGIG